MTELENKSEDNHSEELETLSAKVFGQLFRGGSSFTAIDRGMWKDAYVKAVGEVKEQAQPESDSNSISSKSMLDVADNSGARRVQCIKVFVGSKRKYASIGDIIVVSVREANPRGRVKKGDIRKAVVVRTAKEVRREDGTVMRFDRNAVVLLNNNNEPIGSRVFGPVLASLLGGKLAALVEFEQEKASDPLQE